MNRQGARRFETADVREAASRVARRALRAKLAAVEHCAPLAARLASDDIEHVHDLRVAVRRAEAACDLYREFLPRRRLRKLRRMLKKLRRAAGAARDDDVLLARLTAEPNRMQLAEIVRRARRHRRDAQRPIEQLYDRLFRRPRFRKRTNRLIKRMGPSRIAEAPFAFGPWAASRMRSFLEDFLEASERDLSQRSLLHQFRVRGKRLRYAVELLASAYPADRRQELYQRLSEIQDQLGEINDNYTGIAAVQAMQSQRDAPAVRERIAVWLAGQEDRAKERHKAFVREWAGGRAKELRSIIRSLDTPTAGQAV